MFVKSENWSRIIISKPLSIVFILVVVYSIEIELLSFLFGQLFENRPKSFAAETMGRIVIYYFILGLGYHFKILPAHKLFRIFRLLFWLL